MTDTGPSLDRFMMLARTLEAIEGEPGSEYVNVACIEAIFSLHEHMSPTIAAAPLPPVPWWRLILK